VEKEVLAAFKEIHALNVIHGDIRPANILVTEDENKVWIIDFENGQILADGDEGRESEISNEMEAVHEMLRDIRTRSGRGDCVLFPASGISTTRVSSLEVC